VEKAMVSSGRTCGDVMPFDQQNLETTDGAVSGSAGSCYSATNDDDVILIARFIIAHKVSWFGFIVTNLNKKRRIGNIPLLFDLNLDTFPKYFNICGTI
jgi:hypothetical protein